MKKQEGFNFKEFEKGALDKLKKRESLTGEDGIFTPYIIFIIKSQRIFKN